LRRAAYSLRLAASSWQQNEMVEHAGAAIK